ncbi:hypothetical protein EYC84_007679 [Monilinia fructicola]|uniref:Uncharacterized protein n=1 Tax=Monilinia fructicola TaxID=38448 RepID=A0A5M9JJW8_MONFR|nr:hypothetical protein EYC84_007679 [Monilinia fructicola]
MIIESSSVEYHLSYSFIPSFFGVLGSIPCPAQSPKNHSLHFTTLDSSIIILAAISVGILMNQIPHTQSASSFTSTMVTANLSPVSHTSTSSPPIHHRQNRRRERPGSRARRTISHSSFYIPNHRPGNGSSPILRQTFDQSWIRWKARQAAELEMLAMKENMRQLEMEREMMVGEAKVREEKELERIQRRLFGGEEDDEAALCSIKAVHPSIFPPLSQNKYQILQIENSIPHTFQPPKFRRTESIMPIEPYMRIARLNFINFRDLGSIAQVIAQLLFPCISNPIRNVPQRRPSSNL